MKKRIQKKWLFTAACAVLVCLLATCIEAEAQAAIIRHAPVPIEKPTVITQNASNIGEMTATANGTITSVGGANVKNRGFCWNTTGTPTTQDSVTSETGSFGKGTFSATITGLNSEATYYVRAYAMNSNDVAYGDQVSFTTTSQCKPDYSLYAPEGNDISHQPTFSWQKIDGVTWYNVSVYSETANCSVANQWFDATVICTDTICSTQLNAAMVPGQYWWWITTWSEGTCGFQIQPSGQYKGFTVEPCAIPTLISPNGDILSRIEKPIFTFSDSGDEWYNVMTWSIMPWGQGLTLNIWVDAAVACDSGTCTVSSPNSFPLGTTWWWLNTWGQDCGYQTQPGGSANDFTVP